ncbi:DUF2164 domain-containing protein [Cohnella yongneupensis]|uniref:DUF2164 domain-containing protein n=1 Tax=Cohnella yongneupensis TaxID=425006 RepID=A0ABW0QZC5_9BACL
MIPIKLPREDKMQLVHRLQHYFEVERDESIGELAAEQLVDFMIGAVGPYVYNTAVADTRRVIQEKMNQLEDELYSLEKPASRNNR